MKKTVTKKKKVVKKVAPKIAKSVKKLPVKPVKIAKEIKPVKKSPSDIPMDEKQKIIKAFALKDGDTGSPEVQVAIATQKITNLIVHLKQNPKDNHSRRGLLKIVAKRRRILNYLQKKDEKRYKDLIKKLDLKK